MSVQTVRPQEVNTLHQTGKSVPIIDVRTPAEYASVHVQGAQLMPLDTLDPAALMAALGGSADKTLCVICKTGGRAAKACEKFRAAGFANVFSIEGGVEAWEHAGLPVVRGSSNVISLERQ